MKDLVTIRHVGDPVEAQMLVYLLEQEGIVAIVPGNQHNAMMGGLLSGALNVPLKVPAAEAERAKEILEALDEYDEVDPEDAAPSAPDLSATEGDGPYRGAATPEDPPPRKKTVAIAAALIMPFVLGAFGSGHFYSRSYARGFVLLAAGWGCLLMGMSGQKLAWLGLPLVIVLDIAGALSAISQRAR